MRFSPLGGQHVDIMAILADAGWSIRALPSATPSGRASSRPPGFLLRQSEGKRVGVDDAYVEHPGRCGRNAVVVVCG